MIYDIGQKTRRELVEIAEIQIEEYKKLQAKFDNAQDELEDLHGLGHEQSIKAEALREVLKLYDQYIKKNGAFNAMSLEKYVLFQANEFAIQVDELRGIDDSLEYLNSVN